MLANRETLENHEPRSVRMTWMTERRITPPIPLKTSQRKHCTEVAEVCSMITSGRIMKTMLYKQIIAQSWGCRLWVCKTYGLPRLKNWVVTNEQVTEHNPCRFCARFEIYCVRDG